MSYSTEIRTALAGWEKWNDLGVAARAEILRGFAASQAADATNLINWQLDNALQRIDEVIELPGPTGEANSLATSGRGLFICASTSNNPLALIGEVCSALVAGNVVLVLGTEAEALVKQLHAAGVASAVALPEAALEGLLEEDGIAGIAYCGEATEIRQINRQLASRPGVLAQMVAETDGDQLSSIASPHYINRFITERTRSDNTTAVGGNATLLELGAD